MEALPIPEPEGDEVLVRVVGAGVCHSDLHVLEGMFDDQMRSPVTMGHEIAGSVAAMGPRVRELDLDQAVAVMVGWGCGFCSLCVSGHEQLCPSGDEAGATVDGGFAEFVLIPHRRHVVPVSVDPLDATPLGCAALSSYAAVKRIRSYLGGAGGSVLIIGAGGLGQFAIQFARLMTGAQVIAVDRRPEQLRRAEKLGADYVIEAGEDAATRIEESSQGGVEGVIDFVGLNDTLALATRVVKPRGVVALLGLAGGTAPFGFYNMQPEVVLTTVVAGTILDLQEVVNLADRGRIITDITTYGLNDVNTALEDLRAGRVIGRAVLQPGRSA